MGMEALVSCLYDTSWDDLRQETIQAAKLTLMDTIGAIAAGMRQDEMIRLTDLLAGESPGSCSMPGSAKRASYGTAAFLIGTACVATEMDEGNQFSKGHPAAHVVPVILAYLQKRRYTGKELLTLLVKAYEACSRFGRAASVLPEGHVHGTWGAAGAAAAACLMEGLPREQWLQGVRLGAAFALPTQWRSALDGHLVRNVYTGHAAEAAMKTAALLKSGFTAPDDNLSYVFGRVLGTSWNEDALMPSGDGVWDIQRNYFKPYAFCRYVHAPIDAFRKVMDTHQLAPDQIRKVKVRTYARASTLSSQNVSNALAAKFSIPYALAVWAFSKRADESVFSNDFLADEKVRAFAKKVEVAHDPELEREYPRIMPAVVEIADEEGRVCTERTDIAEGGPGKGLTVRQLQDKFIRLTESVYSAARQRELLDTIGRLEELDDGRALVTLWAGEE